MRLDKGISTISFILMLILLIGCREENGELVLINQSSQDLVNITVGLSSNINKIPKLKVGTDTSLLFKDYTDSHYIISGYYASGENFNYEFGYVTSGIQFSDSLIFLDNRKYNYKFHIK